MERTRLWLRWSWRDLRGRWPQVVAIALVIALGTGSYAGLSSVTRWREISTSDAYETLNLHDVRFSLSEGSTLPQGALLAALDSLPSRSQVEAAEERLAVDLQVDASTGDQAILVPGRLYGLDFAEGGPHVDDLHPALGRELTADDAGQPVVAIEHNFGRHYDLPPSGTVSVSGGHRLDYIGHAITPEFIIVTTERGGILAEANFAALFTSLDTAQRVAGAKVVNQLVVALRPGVDFASFAAEAEAEFARVLPGSAVTVTSRSEEPSVRINDNDIEGDQALYNIFAVLIFGGAVVAAFNLTARIVEAQRREIGIAMVLGVPPARIAIRPLLVGAQIAVLGVVFGIIVGYLIGLAMTALLKELMPLPRWDTSFQFAIFARVAALGFVLPFLATVWPVVRAVRMKPVEAIRSGYRAARGSGLAPLLRRLLPWGNTFQRMPMRNLLRSPRRNLLTALGIAAAVTVLIGFAGLIDTFTGTVDRQERIIGDGPDRLEVQLDNFYPISGGQVAAVRALPAVQSSTPQLRLDGTLRHADNELSVQLDVLDLHNDVWVPPISEQRDAASPPGIYLTSLALENLGASVGDSVRLQHARIARDGSLSIVESDIRVLGTHPHPFRFVAYMDISSAGLFGLEGTTNLLQVSPVPSVSLNEAKRELFPMPGVSSTVGAGETSQAFRDLLNEFVGFLRVVEACVLLLALLIAFNAASINADERVRENATMFAFGIRVRTVVAIGVVENLALGVLATLAGIGGGWVVLKLVLATTVPNTLPDIDFVPEISSLTLALAGTFGILAVGAAPLLTIRRLRRLDIPAALKVAE